ncbi:MAG: hypothetical protein ACQET7_00965 [Thermodesulfobacteriota bacterium]
MNGSSVTGPVEGEFRLDSPFRAPAERLGVGIYLIQDGRLKYVNRKSAGLIASACLSGFI